MSVGTLVVSRYSSPSGSLTQLTLDWTSDSSGNVSQDIGAAYGDVRCVRGGLVGVETIPGLLGVPATDPPTDQYDITLLNPYGLDITTGALVDRSNTTAERVLPTVSIPNIRDIILTIANAGAVNSGRIILYFVELDSIQLGSIDWDYDVVKEAGDGYLVLKAYADLTGFDSAVAFTVTGDVVVKVIGVVGATAITSTSGTTTLSIGTAEATGGVIAASTINNTQFAATDVWVDSTPANDVEAMASAAWCVVGGGADIVLTRSVDDITAGSLTLYCWWKPLSNGATVVPVV